MAAPDPVRILIVEDEFLIRLTLTEALTDEGFLVAEAESGDDALALIEGGAAFDLLLTDVQLPGRTDGIALARAAHVRNPELAIIFVSGRPDSVAKGKLSDRQMFIPKPYLPSDVVSAIRRLVG